MQLPRLTAQAVVRILTRETAEFTAAADRFAGRFPAARMTLAMEDFNLYELTLGRGRYVECFARAFNVGPQTFGELDPVLKDSLSHRAAAFAKLKACLIDE